MVSKNSVQIDFITDTSQLDKAIRASRSFETRVNRLQKAMAKGVITDKQYKRSLRELVNSLTDVTGSTERAEAAALGYASANWKAIRSTRVQTEVLNQQSVALSKGYRAVNQFGEVSQVAGKRTNKFGMQAQQAGYQIGDFAVQLQGGTNWAVALGQQGSQLLGIFGAGGAIAGAALAISTALINPLLRARDSAKELNDEFDEYLNKTQKSALLEQSGGEKALLIARQASQASEEARKASEQMLDAQEKLLALQKESAGANPYTFKGPEAEQMRRAAEAFTDSVEAYKLAESKRVQAEIAENALNIAKQLSRSEVQEAENVRRTQEILNRKDLEERLDAADQVHAHMMALQSAYTSKVKADNQAIIDAAIARDSLRAFDLAAQYANYGSGQQSARERISSGYKLPGGRVSSSGGSSRREEIIRLTEVQRELNRQVESFSDIFESGVMSVVDGSKSMGQALRSMATETISELYRVLVLQRLIGSFGYTQGTAGQAPSLGGTGLAGFLGTSLFGGAFGGFRASGGTVMPGNSYVVGEKGPELFTPGSRGTITSNQNLGSSGGRTEVMVSLSPELIGEIVTAAGQQSVALIQQNNKSTQKSLGPSVNSFSVRGTS